MRWVAICLALFFLVGWATYERGKSLRPDNYNALLCDIAADQVTLNQNRHGEIETSITITNESVRFISRRVGNKVISIPTNRMFPPDEPYSAPQGFRSISLYSRDNQFIFRDTVSNTCFDAIHRVWYSQDSNKDKA